MSKPVTITVSHELGKAGAKDRIDNGFQQFSEKLGLGVAVNRRWSADTLEFDASAFSQSVNGSIEVTEANAIITVYLPALLAGMAETIKGKLQKESTLLLEKK